MGPLGVLLKQQFKRVLLYVLLPVIAALLLLEGITKKIWHLHRPGQELRQKP
jgi:hypothetical protein